MTGRQIEIFILHILMSVMVYLFINYFIIPLSIFEYIVIEILCVGGFVFVNYMKKL